MQSGTPQVAVAVAASPPGATGAGGPARKAELVALFEAHGALADPALLDDLCGAPDGPIRVQAVLSSLTEVPFHFDGQIWFDLESRTREQAVPPPPDATPTGTPEAVAARKEAMRRNAAAVYDMQRRARMRSDGDADPGEDGDAEEEDPDASDAGAGGAEAEAEGWAREDARRFRIEARSDSRPAAAQHEARLEVLADMTGNSTCEGATSDFVAYFRDRYQQIAKMLRARRELRNAIAIDRVKPGAQEVQLIVMVGESYTAKSGNRVFEGEDETGTIRCLVRQEEKQLSAMAATLVSDEVVGLVGQASPKGDMLFVQSIVRPDIPRPDHQAPRGSDVPLMAAFLSDIHVGSKTFLHDNWKRMLRWLSGHADSRRERDAAGRVKYLVVPGDLVDGVGIYPGQQDELSIGDIYDQYAAFGDYLKAIPGHIQLVVQPGNHDATRPAEPQPAFSPEVRTRFDTHAARFVANPASFRMHGVHTLGYHGFSLIDFANAVANLEYEKPLPIMKQMLQSRHLAPLYGQRTPVAPEHKDYLVVSEVPDLFVTGHVHVPGLELYRGVQMVNCGTWQSQTAYQKMLNFTPDPCRMPIIDLQTLRGTLVDFQAPPASAPADGGAPAA